MKKLNILYNEWAIGIMLVLLAKLCCSCSIVIDDRDQEDNKQCKVIDP